MNTEKTKIHIFFLCASTPSFAFLHLFIGSMKFTWCLYW